MQEVEERERQRVDEHAAGGDKAEDRDGLCCSDVRDQLAGDVDADEQRGHRFPVVRFARYSRLATVCTPPRIR